MPRTLRVAAVGDVIFTRAPSPRLALAALADADLRTANLEGPITDHPYPADKLIPLRMPPQAAAWVQGAGFDVVSLANNHAMDYGTRGLLDTLAAMEGVGVAVVGAGPDLATAVRHHLRTVEGVRVATLGLASTVPSGFAAGEGRPGIAPVRVFVTLAVDGALNEEQPGTPPWVHTRLVDDDLSIVVGAVRSARAEADVVVVHVHWGVPPEWSSPFQGDLAEYQRPLGHALIDAGAHLVIGHHAHALHGAEAYGGGLIFYSLGNFAFHPYADRREFMLRRPAPPFRTRHGERNKQSLVALVTLQREGGAWQVREARLTPARLNELGEAEAVDEAGSASVLEVVTSSDANHAVRYDVRADHALLTPTR